MNDCGKPESGPMPATADNFDYQAAQHHDMTLLQQVTIDRLVEMHRIAGTKFTWLNEKDVEGLACACGLFTEYQQAIQPKVKNGTHG